MIKWRFRDSGPKDKIKKNGKSEWDRVPVHPRAAGEPSSYGDYLRSLPTSFPFSYPEEGRREKKSEIEINTDKASTWSPSLNWLTIYWNFFEGFCPRNNCIVFLILHPLAGDMNLCSRGPVARAHRQFYGLPKTGFLKVIAPCKTFVIPVKKKSQRKILEGFMIDGRDSLFFIRRCNESRVS